MLRHSLLKMRDLITSMLFASFIVFNVSKYSFISVVILSGILFLNQIAIDFLQKNKIITLVLLTMQKRMLLFTSFCFISALWASNVGAAFQDGISILANIICVSIVYNCYQNDESIERLVKAVMFGGFLVSIYIVSYYGIINFIANANSSIRLTREVGNANAIGFIMSISLVIFVYDFFKNGLSMNIILSLLSLIILAISQSRTALLTFGVGFILVIVNLRNNDLKSILKALFLISAILVLIWLLVTKTVILGGINARMVDLFLAISGKSIAEGSFSERMTYITGGISSFIKHPILGIGIGNSYTVTQSLLGYTTYLHNNFIELLVCGGLIGFLLYYSMYYYLFNKLTKHNKLYHNNSYDYLCIILAIMMLVADFGRVSYYKKETYFLLMIIFLNVFINKNVSKKKRS